MNKLAVGIISGVVGLGVGVGVGIFGTREYWKHIYLDRVEVEVESVRRHFRAKEGKGATEFKHVDPIKDDEEPEDDPPEEEENGKYWKRASRYWSGVNDKKPSLDELASRVNEDLPKKAKDEPAGKFPDPYVISEAEFEDNPLNHEQRSVRYHFPDQVVADEETDEILDIRMTIGYDAIDAFEDDVVYVRNERTGTDYEVIAYEESYASYVVGIDYGEDAGMKTRDKVRQKSRNMKEEEDEE